MTEVIERNEPVVVRERRGHSLVTALVIVLILIVGVVIYSRYHPFSVNGTKDVTVPVPNVNSSQSN